MFNQKSGLLIILLSLCLANFFQFTSLHAQDSKSWKIMLTKEMAKDEAIKVAVDDIKLTAKSYGIEIEVIDVSDNPDGNVIIVGAPDKNEQTKKVIQKNSLKLEGVKDLQGYEIKTIYIENSRIIIVSGGSVIGEVNALFWILDRLKVYKKIPEINDLRVPAMKIRFTGRGGDEEGLRNALRGGATWVSGNISANNLVPWNSEPERSNNAKRREKVRKLIEYAHKLHLKYIIFEDEFSYHPTLLEEFGATLNPEDPAFWDAVQAKYRRLLQAMPEIDGIRIRTGELTRVGGTYKPFDVMHDGENCDWSLAKRYRTYVKKMYNVVVGEFDKIYFQRTWVTSAHEQHSMATVYKNIFTDDIPVKNLYMSPYLSTTDRYFHQPYNPTFNLTPHNMILLLATLDYHSHSGVKTFPTFPGQYYQGGIETILSADPSNLKGFDFGDYGPPSSENWNTGGVTTYTITRLAWDPDEDMTEIVKDFASICFGPKAAEAMAEIYLLSPNAYKYGIYIEPVSHGDFRSLPHLRLTTFPAKGLPRLDGGKKHVDFLRTIYLRCRPWKTETFLYLDHGLEVANKMVDKYEKTKKLIEDPKLAQDVENAINLTYWLIKTNNIYVRAMFSYFEYREKPTDQNKQDLDEIIADLNSAMDTFSKMPGCIYRLDGMKQLVVNANRVLDNLQQAEKELNAAPDEEGIKTLISDLQKKYVKILEENKEEAVKICYWQARVDGRDLMKVRLDQLEIEHLRYDHIAEMEYNFENSLPEKEVTVIPMDIQSRSYGPFVLEQPTKENDYTVTLYLSDFPRHGYSWWKMELYYIPKSPKELGIETPW